MSACQTSTSAHQHPQGEGEKDEEVWKRVQKYYGETMQKKEDVETGVNCSEKLSDLPEMLRHVVRDIHPDVTNRYYGCGLVIPEALEGCSVLDLGCGTGRDCFVISKLVTASGKVVGVDMTPQQLDVARQYVDYHREKFGFSQPNVEFLQGYIERLGEAGLQDNTFDIEISNGCFNLCPDKMTVFREAYRVLKEGGELYFSDVYCDTHLAPEIRNNSQLWGQCVAGAIHWEELYQLAMFAGFSEPRLVTCTLVNTCKYSHILGGARFISATYRTFKIPPAPTSTPRPPAVVTYNGGITASPDCLKLDCETSFVKGQSVAVDGELAAILSSSRFRSYFSFEEAGDVTPVTVSPKRDPFQKAVTTVTLCCS